MRAINAINAMFEQTPKVVVTIEGMEQVEKVPGAMPIHKHKHTCAENEWTKSGFFSEKYSIGYVSWLLMK